MAYTIQIGSDTICDGPDRSANKNAGPSGLRIVGQIASQVAEYLRATDAVVINRGNRRTQISFAVKRLCASVDAANLYATMHAATVTRSGTVTITSGSAVITISDAVLDVVDCAVTGLTVHVSYSIIGGAVEGT